MWRDRAGTYSCISIPETLESVGPNIYLPDSSDPTSQTSDICVFFLQRWKRSILSATAQETLFEKIGACSRIRATPELPTATLLPKSATHQSASTSFFWWSTPYARPKSSSMMWTAAKLERSCCTGSVFHKSKTSIDWHPLVGGRDFFIFVESIISVWIFLGPLRHTSIVIIVIFRLPCQRQIIIGKALVRHGRCTDSRFRRRWPPCGRDLACVCVASLHER